MRNLAHLVTELVVERVGNLRREPAWEGDFRLELEDQLLAEPPEEGQSPKEVFERAAHKILPFAARIDHPRFFGFIPSSPTWPSVLADFMVAGYQVNQCTWLTSSGPSQLELVVIDWFRRWIGYPEEAGGLFTSGGSAASLDAFVAAREAAGNPERATVYMSDQSHSALSRAAMIIGVRRECIRMVPSDKNFRLDMEALAKAVQADRTAGFNPLAVCATAGTASTGAVDPLEMMADFCEEEKIWMHVDAAYGGFAVLTEEGRKLLQGLERADSIGLDAHKWLFQPYEAGSLLVKDGSTLEKAFAVHPDILQGHGLGKGPSQLRGSWSAAESLGARPESLGVNPDIRDGCVPAGGSQRHGTGQSGGSIRPRQSNPGEPDSRVVGNSVPSAQPCRHPPK